MHWKYHIVMNYIRILSYSHMLQTIESVFESLKILPWIAI